VSTGSLASSSSMLSVVLDDSPSSVVITKSPSLESESESELWSLSEGSIGSEDGKSSGNVLGTYAIEDDALLGAKSSEVKTEQLTG